MSKSENCEMEPWMQPRLIRELEAALIEYVERYGLTERSRAVLIKIGRAASTGRHIDKV